MMASTLLLNAQFNFRKDPFITKSLSSGSDSKSTVEPPGVFNFRKRVSAGESKIEVYVTGNRIMKSLSKDDIQKKADEYYPGSFCIKSPAHRSDR